MQIIEVDTNKRGQVKAFLELPFKIYKDIPQWVPPLEMDASLMLDRKRHPFYRHSDAAFFMAYDDAGQPAGRLAVLDHRRYNEFNHERTAFFYLFECINDTKTAEALFASACQWAERRGLDKIFGPKGFTPFDGFGLLVKGFEHRPAFGLPYNPPYYPALVEAAGFTACDDSVSGYLNNQMPFPEKIHRASELIQKRRGLHIARYRTRRDLQVLIPRLKEMYNNSLDGTIGNYPLDDGDVKAIADQMLWFADPRLIKIVMKDDQPVGYLFAYPDISAALQKTRGKLFPFGWLALLFELRRTDWININGAGMIEKYRGLGGTGILFSEMYKSIQNSRYKHADLVQVGVENDNMQRELAGLGIDFYKVHRTYQLSI